MKEEQKEKGKEEEKLLNIERKIVLVLSCANIFFVVTKMTLF